MGKGNEKNLYKAKGAKNDEFYIQLNDASKELVTFQREYPFRSLHNVFLQSVFFFCGEVYKWTQAFC